MNLYTPKFATSSTWQSSVGLVTSQLRKIKFVVEKTFSWGNFDPKTDFGGMGSSAYILKGARYLRIYKLLLFRVHISVTLAGGSSSFSISMPPGCTAGGDASVSEKQAGYVQLSDAVTADQPATWYTIAPADLIVVRPPNGALYAAGATTIVISGIIEVA